MSIAHNIKSRVVPVVARAARAAAALIAALPLSALPLGPSAANDEKPVDAPTFQGHAAEMLRRDEASEQRRRMLFFDSVDVEIGPQGLPCDHLARRRPEVVAGPGYVVVLTIQAAKPLQVRVWFAPGTPITSIEALKRAQALAVQNGATGDVQAHDLQAFLWCR